MNTASFMKRFQAPSRARPFAQRRGRLNGAAWSEEPGSPRQPDQESLGRGLFPMVYDKSSLPESGIIVF